MFKKRKTAGTSAATASAGSAPGGEEPSEGADATTAPSSDQPPQRKAVKLISLSIGNDDDGEEEQLVVISRSKKAKHSSSRPGLFHSNAAEMNTASTSSVGGLGSALAGEDEAPANEYSVETIKAMREANRARDHARDTLPPPVAILSGEDAHDLLKDENPEEEVDDEDYDVKRPPGHPGQAQLGAKSIEVESVVSSVDDSDDENNDSSSGQTKAASEDTIEVFLADLEAVKERLEQRQSQIAQEQSTTSSQPDSIRLETLRSSLSDATSRLRSLERIDQFARTLVSCLRVKMAVLQTADDVLAAWNDVNDEYKIPSRVVMPFSDWENLDAAEFDLRVGGALADILVPYTLSKAYAENCALDDLPNFISGFPEVNQALTSFSIKIKDKVLAALQSAAHDKYQQWVSNS